jgi:hypothetical protein
MNQYIHLLSNSGIGLPTDLWVSSTDKVKPQSSKQVAIGLAKDINERDITITLEGYYKNSDDVISYKEGASFLIFDDFESTEEVSWEDNITFGQAWSHGVELLIQKKIGKFSGWLGYTLSKTEKQFDEINFGNKYLAKYDRTHDVSLVGIYKKSEKLTLSATWIYGTGNNYTLPVGTYRTIYIDNRNNFNGPSSTDDYESKNNFRAEAYHRFDIGIQFHKKKKHGNKTWELSLYNAYNRRNPFFYYFDNEYQNNVSETKLKKVSIFPIIPSFKYTFEF